MNKVFILLSLIVISIFYGCSSASEIALQNAKKTNTIESYQSVVTNYPNSPEARWADYYIYMLQDSLAWSKANDLNNAQEYFNYFRKYQNGRYYPNVIEKLTNFPEIFTQLKDDELVKTKSKIEQLILPFQFDEINKAVQSPVLAYKNSEYLKSKPKPQTDLIACLIAKRKENIIRINFLTTKEGGPGWGISDDGIPSFEYNPNLLVSLHSQINDSKNFIGFTEIKFYSSNNTIKEHLIYSNMKWYRIN